jgi:periplasmic divalent cation tolerance protein
MPVCADTFSVEKFVQTVTTTASRADARRIGRALVDRRLAACVQIVGPIESTYRWQGKVATAREWLCLIKTTSARYPQVATAIEALHPYDTPEIIAVPIVAGSRRYLDWLASSVRPPAANPKSKTQNRKSPRRVACR